MMRNFVMMIAFLMIKILLEIQTTIYITAQHLLIQNLYLFISISFKDSQPGYKRDYNNYYKNY